MTGPPVPRGDRLRLEALTWRDVLLSVGLVAAVPVLLWVLHRPLTGTATLAGLGALLVGGRRLHDLGRCYQTCERFSVDVAGRARITVSQRPAEDCC